MNVVCYGMGYLGHAYSSWLANIGHNVTTIGELKDTDKIEPDLQDQIERMTKLGRLRNGGTALYRLETAEVVWFTFDTPITPEGEADVDFVVQNVVDLCDYVHESVPILISSQVPVGTMAQLETRCGKHMLAYIPENVRVGRACGYLQFPDRFILGTRHAKVIEPVVQELVNITQRYRPTPIPVLVMSPESAEMVKHCINCFLATCISFSNEMAQIVSAVGADPTDVTLGIQSEQRIGDKLPLKPGGPFKTGHLERDMRYVDSIALSHNLRIPTLCGVTLTNNRLKALA